MKIIYFLLETFLPYETLLSTIILLSACLLIILIFEEFARSLYRLSDQFFFRILVCVTTDLQEKIICKVSYIYRGELCKEGYCVMSIDVDGNTEILR